MGKPKADDDDDKVAVDRADDREDENDSDSDADSGTKIRPSKSKVGESKDNLRQRSDWFQRRR
jgi:hypothetical protein